MRSQISKNLSQHVKCRKKKTLQRFALSESDDEGVLEEIDKIVCISTSRAKKILKKPALSGSEDNENDDEVVEVLDE